LSLNPNAVRKLAADYTAAWNSGDPDRVASFYAENGAIVINRSDAHQGREAMAAMAAGFFAAVPDLRLSCDDLRIAGNHAAFFWTFTGHDSETRNLLSVAGWEEWDIGNDLKVQSSRGWFDAEDYARQIAGT